MNSNVRDSSHRRPFLLVLATLTIAVHVSWAELSLGEPPLPPNDLSGLPRAPWEKSVSGGFSIDTRSREGVRSFYNAIYSASENVPMLSTADIANCVPGTTSQEFKDAVLRRINWYRAMAGVPANVTLNAINNSKDRQAALMMSRNNALSHTPPDTWACWTAEGAEAAQNSNIGIGTTGPETVNGYIRDHGAGNNIVGHRRWLLYPQTQIMATGDVPGQNGYSPANAIWVRDAHYYDARPATRSGFVAWPPAGYVPVQVVYPRWSLSYPGADFSAATVTMLSNGVPISVALEMPVNGYGENTLVWIPMGLDASSWMSSWPFAGQDTVYSVSVANATVNSKLTNFNYSVTVFDPAVPGPDYVAPVLSGPAQPAVGQPNLYTFNPITNATSYQWRHMKTAPYSLLDGAEGGLINFTAATGPYSVIASDPVATGSAAYQLGHLKGALSPQLLTLENTILARSGTTLSFESLLKAAASDQVARVQLSVNDGDWFDIYFQPGFGWPGETSWSLKSVPLSAYAGSALRIRFNYDFSSGTYYPGVDASTGWHLDNISISDAEQPVESLTNNVTWPQFQFVPPEAANYSLQARAIIFSDFPLEWGPAKPVTAVITIPPVIKTTGITMTNGTARIAFSLSSGNASSFRLLQNPQLSGPWTTNTAAVLSTNSPGSYQFTVPAPAAVQFYRVQGT